MELTDSQQEKLNSFQVITAFSDEEYDKVVALLGNNSWDLEASLSKYFDGFLVEPEPVREVPREPVRQRAVDFTVNHMIPQLPIVRPISNKWMSKPGLNRDHFGIQSITSNPLIFILLLIPRTLTFLLTGLTWVFSLLFATPDIPLEPSLDGFNAVDHVETVTRDKCQVEFYKGNFNDVFERCKRESKFMLLILIGENEASTLFIKEVVNNASVSKIINDEEMLVYMGNVYESQGLEIAKTMHTKRIPSVYLLGNVSSGVSNISSMSVLARLNHKSLNIFTNKLIQQVEMYKPELIAKRMELEELEYARKIRELQDQAYAESLVADRVKREKKEQEERVKQEEIDKEEWVKEEKIKFYSSLYGKFEKYDDLSKGEYTTIRFKLPSGESITQRFTKKHSLFDVYCFIDLEIYMKDHELMENERHDAEYQHEFAFELTSPYPRYSVPISDIKVMDCEQLWPSGSVMLEYLQD